MKTALSFAISFFIFFQIAAQSQIDLYPNFKTLGVNVLLSPLDPEGDAWADLEYRTGNGQFTPGFPLSRVDNDFQRLSGCVFWLNPDADCEVKVTSIPVFYA